MLPCAPRAVTRLLTRDSECRGTGRVHPGHRRDPPGLGPRDGDSQGDHARAAGSRRQGPEGAKGMCTVERTRRRAADHASRKPSRS